MRPVVLVFMVVLAGCGISPRDQVVRNDAANQRLAATCRARDERVEKAAHPDAEMIARHDQQEKKASDLIDAAAAQHLQGAALSAALGAAAQAQIEADAIYDVSAERTIAARCWRELSLVQGIRDDSDARYRARMNAIPDVPIVAPAAMPAPYGLPATYPAIPSAPPEGVPPVQWDSGFPRPPPARACIGNVQIPAAVWASTPCP
jgi:hypothetical protein